MTSHPPESIPEKTYADLVQATLAALAKKGYASLRVRDIDAESNKSRQLINHYFSGKDELVTETLSVLIEAVKEELDSSSNGNPAKKLNEEIDRALLGTGEEDEEFWTTTAALYELQAQAQHNPHHQKMFNELLDLQVNHFSTIIQGGINQGVFDEVDSHRMANTIDDLIVGATVKKIHLGRDDAPLETREMIDELVMSKLNPR